MNAISSNSGALLINSITRHAIARMRQRGFRESDLDVILRMGRESEGGKVILADGDIDEEIAAMKREIARLDRLRGATAVVTSGRVLTIYKQDRRARRRLRRED